MANNENKKESVFQEELYLGHFEGDPEEDLLNYFLSNSYEEIEKIINSRIQNSLPSLEKIYWGNNTEGLAQKVKDMMNKWDVKYSMTISPDRKDKTINHVVVNWHNDKEWLFYGGVIISRKYFFYEEVGAY